jgi:putative FmdB family regulatory protein
MPTYEYACTACANQWEEIQKISADPLDTCPKCGQKTAKRQISGGNFILKGGGWYADLYSSSSNKSGAKAEPSASTKSESTATTSTTTTKAESTAPAAAKPAAPSGSSGPSTPSKT